MYFSILLASFTGCIIISASYGSNDAKIISTKLGKVEGTVHYTINGTKPVYTFYSVPYGQQPERFQHSKPAEPWKGVRDASKVLHACIPSRLVNEGGEDFMRGVPLTERTDIYSENCLEVDVYTPDVTGNLAVMVWFHGGGYWIGTGHNYNGTALAALNQVVVVTVNFRIGTLGFLSTGDDILPGNYGLLDQVLALKWIKDNIRAFGGNPNSVTIFGESAGGFSCLAHLLSPLSKGLFQRAIMQSGSVTSWMDYNPINSFQIATEITGCKHNNVHQAVECMKHLSQDDLWNMPPVVFRPVIDRYLFPKDPADLQKEADFNNVEIMTGFVANEGYFMVQLIPNLPPNTEFEYDEFYELSKSYLYTLPDDIIHKVTKKFSNGGKDPTRQGIDDITSYFLFIGHIIDTAHYVKANGGTVFMYQFNHAPSFKLPRRPAHLTKAIHFDDTYIMFGLGWLDCFAKKYKDNVFNEEDFKVSQLMMKYWTNFAKYGNPNSDDTFQWPEYDNEEQKYIEIDLQPTISQHYKPEIMEFYHEITNEAYQARQQRDEL